MESSGCGKRDLQGTGVEVQETRLGDPRGDPKGRDNVEFSSSCFDGGLKVQLANGARFRLQRFEQFRGADVARMRLPAHLVAVWR